MDRRWKKRIRQGSGCGRSLSLLLPALFLAGSMLISCGNAGNDELYQAGGETSTVSISMNDIVSDRIGMLVDETTEIDATVTPQDVYKDGVATYLLEDAENIWASVLSEDGIPVSIEGRKGFLTTGYRDGLSITDEPDAAVRKEWNDQIRRLVPQFDRLLTLTGVSLDAFTQVQAKRSPGDAGFTVTERQVNYNCYERSFMMATNAPHETIPMDQKMSLGSLDFDEAEEKAGDIVDVLYPDETFQCVRAYSVTKEMVLEAAEQICFAYANTLKAQMEAGNDQISEVYYQSALEDAEKLFASEKASIEEAEPCQYLRYVRELDGIPIGLEQIVNSDLQNTMKENVSSGTFSSEQESVRKEMLVENAWQGRMEHLGGDAAILLGEGNAVSVSSERNFGIGRIFSEKKEIVNPAGILEKAIGRLQRTALAKGSKAVVTEVQLVYWLNVLKEDNVKYLVYYPYWSVNAYYASDSEQQMRLHTIVCDAYTGSMVGQN